MSIFNSSAIARKQCTSRVAQAQHVSYLQIFSRDEALIVVFVNLDVSCTVVEIFVLLLCTYVCTVGLTVIVGLSILIA